MPSFNTAPSLLPLVIAPEVWQSAVDFPDDPKRTEERMDNLLLSILLTLRTAGVTRERITFTIYCQPPQGDVNVPVSLPLSLTRAAHWLKVSMAAQG